jgi:gluconate kinase
MEQKSSLNSIDSGNGHATAVQRAHAALAQRLCQPSWSADDFYSAMAVYRQAAGIEFSEDDDTALDKWLEAAAAAWMQEVALKGDRINLAEALEKAIAAGITAIRV